MSHDIASAVIGLCGSLGPACVRGSTARRKIKGFFKDKAFSPDDLVAFFTDLDQRLGPFDGLPEAFRANLAAAAEFRIREDHLLSHAGARFLAHGPLLKMGASLVHGGWKLKGGRLDRLHPYLMTLGRKAQKAAPRLAQDLLRRLRFTRFYKAPFLHVLWTSIEFDPGALLQDYIQNIPVDHRVSPVFKVPSLRTEACALIGIDLLPARGKLYFLEANFNVGHHIDRHRLFPQGDTVCRHLLDWAAEKGYPRVVFFPTNYTSIREDIEEAWHQIAADRGVGLEIVDNPYRGSPWPRSRTTLMDLRSPRTLFVNGRYLAGPLARLVGEKGLLEREIGRFNATLPAERQVPVPKMIVRQDDVPPLDKDGLFPNIIVKNARVDQAQGVSLYRTTRLPEEANSWPRLAYEFVVPDLIVREEREGIRRYVSIFRSYLLITTEGPVYLGARKDVSSMPVPDALPLGTVANASLYITNLHLGAHSEAHSEMEDEKCRAAVLSLGAVIDRFIKNKYEMIVKGPVPRMAA